MGKNQDSKQEQEPTMQLKKIYRRYALVTSILRNLCLKNGLIEFLPARDVKGYTHLPEQHVVVNHAPLNIILPYQQSIFNRLSAHFLDEPVFCIGPCYRNEGISARHSHAFYQFSFEIFTENLRELADFTLDIISGLFIELNIANYKYIKEFDMRTLTPNKVTKFSEMDTANGKPLLITYKKLGLPPLINRCYDKNLEEAIELILPPVGETLDGGVRDPQIIYDLYGINTTRPTSGASIGLERLIAFIEGKKHIHSTMLL